MRGIFAGLIAGVLSVGAVALPAQAAGVTANDPGYGAEWGVRNARVDQAWATGQGNGRTIVAVVDTGVTAIPDLAGRLLPGHDFVNNDDDASDDNGHGTMAAQVIAAAGNNHTGVAGICWSCEILPVKVLDAKGGGGYDKIAEGIRYAADQGAQIISLSLGGSSDSDLLRDAVAYAKDKGSLVIAAAGNAGSSAPHYPAAVPSVLSVGAVTDTGARYSWSNYGSWVNITAPGCNPAESLSGVVTQYCGTSSATPFVAGVAGLLASTDPAPDADQIKAALIASEAKPSGRVDAVNALLDLPYAGDTTRPSLVLGATPAVARGTTAVWGSATDQHGVARVELWIGGRRMATDTSAPYSFTWATPVGTTTARTVELRAFDRAGNMTSTSRVVRSDNQAPSLSVTAAGGVVTARAADASGIAKLEVVVKGKVVGSFAGTTWAVHTSVAHLQIRAYDRAGNVRVWQR